MLLASTSAGAQQPDWLNSSVVRGALIVLSGADTSTWPGYAPSREFVVCPTGGGGLYALREPPSGASDMVQLAEVRGTRLYQASARPYGLERQCFRLNFSFENRDLLSFPQLDSIYSLRDPVRATAAALVHEEFHRYQSRAFAPTPGPEGFYQLEAAPRLPRELIESVQFQQLAGEERRLLAEALITEWAGRKRSVLARYLEIRDRRMQMVPEHLRAGEAHEERKEGSAHLVSYEFVAAATGEEPGYVVALVRSDLLSTPGFSENPQQSSYRHWHIYATGAAIGLVLEQLGFDWRQSVEGGSTFLDSARSAVDQQNNHHRAHNF